MYVCIVFEGFCARCIDVEKLDIDHCGVASRGQRAVRSHALYCIAFPVIEMISFTVQRNPMSLGEWRWYMWLWRPDKTAALLTWSTVIQTVTCAPTIPLVRKPLPVIFWHPEIHKGRASLPVFLFSPSKSLWSDDYKRQHIDWSAIRLWQFGELTLILWTFLLGNADTVFEWE